jgi:BlaI family penicillinase repressor
MEICFTDREADIMAVLWRRGPSTVAEVRAELHDELAYTTVLTMLRTLQGLRRLRGRRPHLSLLRRS